MASKDKNQKRDKRVDKGEESVTVTGMIIRLPFVLVMSLLISAAISTCVEWLGMYNNWWDIQGVAHSQYMVEQELRYLNVRLDKNMFEPLTGLTVDSMFQSTVGAVNEFLNWVGMTRNAASNISGFGHYLGAAANMIVLTTIRFFVFIFSLPLWILFAVVGFTIGVFERDRRRAGGGRESGAVFQLSRKAVLPSIGVAMFCYLSYWDTVDPVIILFPFAMLFGISIAYMSASFKKYI